INRSNSGAFGQDGPQVVDLYVIGGNNQHVVRPHLPYLTITVPKLLLHQACIQLLDYSAFYLTFLRTSSMHSGHEPHAMAAEVWMRISMQQRGLLLVCGFGKQTAIINRIGNETTDVLVHPPGGAQEDALLWCYGSVVLKQIFQRRCTRLPWMHPLDGLSK